MSPFAIVFWVLAAGSLFLPEVCTLYLFICTAAFGALNILPTAGVGGVNLLPQAFAALLLIGRVMLIGPKRTTMLSGLINWRGFVLFGVFVGYAVFSALLYPHLFEGQVDVIGMDNPVRQKLAPSGSNLNQSAYLIVDLLSALALFAYLKGERSGNEREHLMRALVISGVLFIVTGLVEYSGLVPTIVAQFRNASYAMFVTGEVVSIRRIAGFFSEASAYGPRCVVFGTLLFFGRSACRSDLWRVWLCPGVSLVLIAMGALSTSSTAFLCIFTFMALLAIRVALRIYRRSRFSEYALELGVMGFGALVLLIAWLAQPDLLNVPLMVLNAMVFKKSESSSFYERSFWNHTGKLAFFETHGLGAGAGSARTSNWAISVLSNTGAPGFGLMAAFIVIILMQAGSEVSNRWASLARGAKYAFIVFLVGQVASGTNIDPGLNFAMLAAIIAAGSRWTDPLGPVAGRKSGSKSSSRSKIGSRRGARRSSGASRPQTASIATASGR